MAKTKENTAKSKSLPRLEPEILEFKGSKLLRSQFIVRFTQL